MIDPTKCLRKPRFSARVSIFLIFVNVNPGISIGILGFYLDSETMNFLTHDFLSISRGVALALGDGVGVETRNPRFSDSEAKSAP